MANAGNSRDYKILWYLISNRIKFPEVLETDDWYQIELKKLFAQYYKTYVLEIEAFNSYLNKDGVKSHKQYMRNHYHCARIIRWINNYRIKHWYFKPITNVKWE